MISPDSATTGDEFDVLDPLECEGSDQAWRSASNSQSAPALPAALKEPVLAQGMRSPQPSHHSCSLAASSPGLLSDSSQGRKGAGQSTTATGAEQSQASALNAALQSLTSPCKDEVQSIEISEIVRGGDTLAIDSSVPDTAESASVQIFRSNFVL